MRLASDRHRKILTVFTIRKLLRYSRNPLGRNTHYTQPPVSYLIQMSWCICDSPAAERLASVNCITPSRTLSITIKSTFEPHSYSYKYLCCGNNWAISSYIVRNNLYVTHFNFSHLTSLVSHTRYRRLILFTSTFLISPLSSWSLSNVLESLKHWSHQCPTSYLCRFVQSQNLFCLEVPHQLNQLDCQVRLNWSIIENSSLKYLSHQYPTSYLWSPLLF